MNHKSKDSEGHTKGLWPINCEAYISNGKIGIRGFNNEIIHKPGFDYISEFVNNYAYVEKEGKYGFVNKDGAMVVPCIYEEVGHFSEGLAAVKHGGKWGYINEVGQNVVKCIYARAQDFSEGLAAISLGDVSPGKWFNWNWGYINYCGETIIRNQYSDANGFHNGCAIVNFGEVPEDGSPMQKWGLIDKGGNMITSKTYHKINNFSEGLAVVNDEGLYGYINDAGSLVIPLKYYWADDFSEGLAKIQRPVIFKKKEWAVINLSGSTVECGKRAEYYSNGMIFEFDDEWRKYRLFNIYGKILEPAEWDSARVFSKDGLAAVKFGSKWGFIDKAGDVAIPINFDEVDDFKDGVANVCVNKKWGLIDTKGNLKIEIQYNLRPRLENNGLIALSDRYLQKTVLLDREGNQVILSKNYLP